MSFDAIAPWYDGAETLLAGTLLQRARTTWIDAVAVDARVLSAGEGHGRFADALLQRRPAVELTCLDASPGMRRVAQRRLARHARLARWVHADATAWRPEPASYDVIATHFFLDCFDAASLDRVIDLLATAARPRSLWLVTDFAVPPAGLARVRAAAMHRVMYSAFRRLTTLQATRLTPPDPLLAARGFVLRDRREYSWGLVRADVWQR
ncbi:SAM-dependent methyltransferase [Luteitalea sp. TBR-22]|nr:SAM-dependent methyltransferase [Luteitalea sp. TBR-22]